MTRLVRSAGDFGDYDFGLVFGQVRPDRQAQDRVGQLFRNWKCTSRPDTVRVRAGEMGRNGIVDQSPYTGLGEFFLKTVATRVFNDVKVPNGVSPFRNERKNQISSLHQRFLVALR